MEYSAVTQPLPLPAQVGRHAVLDRGRAEHLRVADADPAGALGPLLDAERHRHRPQLVRPPPRRAQGRAAVPDRHQRTSSGHSGRRGRLRRASPGATPPAPPSPRPTARRAPRTRGRAGRRARSAARRSTIPNRRRNFSLPDRSAASASTPWWRARLTTTIRRSPSSSARAAGALGGGELAQLLGHLGEDPVDAGPVVAEVGGALLHLLAGREGGHGTAHPVEGALRRGRRLPVGRGRGRRRRLRGPLGLLDPLPLAVHVRRRADLRVAEDVGVAADDLAGDRGLDVGQVEDAGLRGQLGVEDDLEPEVAELGGQLRRGAAGEGVVDLVGLLEEVVAQRLVGLLAIPRAAVGLPQAVRDPGHPPRRGGRQLRGDRGEVERGRPGRPRRGRRRSSPRPRRTARRDGPPGRGAAGRRGRRGRRGRGGRGAAPADPPAAAARRTASGTRSAGRDGSSGTAISRSAGTTATPSAGSRPQRRRASASRASSTRPSRSAGGGRVQEPLDRRLGRVVLDPLVPVGEGVVAQRLAPGPGPAPAWRSPGPRRR